MDSERIALAWVDIETTGLDARHDIPLEFGLALTDTHGYPLYTGCWLIHDDTSEYKEKITFASKHPIVGPMHHKSGLWDDLMHREEHGYMTRDQLDNYLVNILAEHEVDTMTIPMAGSSIGSLDRPFCLEHFPNFNSVLSYRNVDISTVKELCRMHNPVLMENIKPIIGSKADAPHRPLGDIDGSIIEYRTYLDNFLIVGD